MAKEADYNWWWLILISFRPGDRSDPDSGSFTSRRLGSGELKTGAPPLGLGVVDVRDVAQAHIACAFSTNAQGRYLARVKTPTFQPGPTAQKRPTLSFTQRQGTQMAHLVGW